MKRCPYCGEEIQDGAIKCRYCREWLNDEEAISQNESIFKNKEEIKDDKKQCPRCNKYDVYRATITDPLRLSPDYIGDWCPHCQKPLPMARKKPEVKGIAGWLLFLCVSLTIIGPMGGVLGLISNYNVYKPLFKYNTIYNLYFIDTFISIVLILFAVYTGINLWQQKKEAVKITRLFLLTVLMFIIIEFALFVLILPDKVVQFVLPELIGQSLARIIAVVIWYLYLIYSKRVKNTYALT
jgi:hypothetical protein